MKLSIALTTGILPLLAIQSAAHSAPRVNVGDGSTIRYTYMKDSDSGYTDINGCLLEVFGQDNRRLATRYVHDFKEIRPQSNENVFCAGLAVGQSRSYRYRQEADNGQVLEQECTLAATGESVSLSFCQVTDRATPSNPRR